MYDFESSARQVLDFIEVRQNFHYITYFIFHSLKLDPKVYEELDFSDNKIDFHSIRW